MGGKHPKSPLSAAAHAAGPLPTPGIERTNLKEQHKQKDFIERGEKLRRHCPKQSKTSTSAPFSSTNLVLVGTCTVFLHTINAGLFLFYYLLLHAEENWGSNRHLDVAECRISSALASKRTRDPAQTSNIFGQVGRILACNLACDCKYL